MGLTILESSKTNGGVTVRDTIVELYARNSDILMALPFMDIAGNAYSYNQEDTLPGIGFRGVNENFDEDTGVLNPQVERLTIAGGNLDVDVALIKFHGAGRRGIEEAMKVKALAHSYTNKFIKGDSESDKREFDGLQKRLTGKQVISNSAAAGGAGVSIANIDELIDAVDAPTHLYMSKAIRRKLSAASRDTSIGGFITAEQDTFGRPQTMYGELPILIADRNGAQGAALQFDEAFSGGGSSVGTSIYCLELGETKLQGLQNGSIDTFDHGRYGGGNKLRTTVEWYAGLLLEHARAASRLRDINDTAAVK